MDKNVLKKTKFYGLLLYWFGLRQYGGCSVTLVFLRFPVFPDKPDLKTLANFKKHICSFILNIMI
jgi:hypothetical protein